MTMLEVSGLTKSFGGLTAVDRVDLGIRQGALFGILGPNGSGKTTLFNMLTGFLEPSSGSVRFEGGELIGQSPERIVRSGVARTFQVVRFHKESTVRETVWAAQSLHLGFGQLFRSIRSSAQKQLEKEVDDILERTWLKPHADRLARELPFGLVRQLEIARALATRPKILLMDEPASGMNPSETLQLTADIRRLRDAGLTIVLIEHDIEMVMGLCDRIAVLNFGRKITEGTPEEVKNNPEVIAAYLGTKKRAMLEIQNLTVSYGAISAVRDVSITVHSGEVVTLIGANGAGKTSIVKALSGLVQKASGTTKFRGLDISRLPAHEIVRRGLIHVPEGRKLVPSMSVEENLLCGAYCRSDKQGIADDLDLIMTRFPRLRERRKQLAGTMSGGERQMLAIGRGLMARPELLILDEPSLGLAPLFVDEVFNIIASLKREGKTILLIEQNALEALNSSDRAYVLRVGEVVMSGLSNDLADDPELRRAYLGIH